MPRSSIRLCNALPARVRALEGGEWRVTCAEPLAAYPRHLLDRLVAGATAHPARPLAAERNLAGGWTALSYAEALTGARAIGQGLLDRGLSPERPLVILLGNGLTHLELALGALYAGVPYAPLSPASLLQARSSPRLANALAQLTPGLMFAGARTAELLESLRPGTELLDSVNELRAAPMSVDAAFAALGPSSIAKFLLTSGSTGNPRVVITTQRMLCSNQQMLLQTFPVFGAEPPVLVDWLPWHHTFGGSHNVGIALYNGGTLYIDGGQPTGERFAETLRNLREVAPTVHFNVPRGWDELARALERDDELAAVFLSRVRFFFHAGAGMSGDTWRRLDRAVERRIGARIDMFSGLGMTETSPGALFATREHTAAGHVGLPAPGCEVRLVPEGSKLEARIRGPHVTPGYWRAPDATARAFDELGYYRTRDAVAWVDALRPERGLEFQGRLADDFKLSTGVFVDVGALRAQALDAGHPFVSEVVVAGENRREVGLLVFPALGACRELGGMPDAPPEAVLASPAVRARFERLLANLQSRATGSASRVGYLVLLAEPPRLDRGELTDKQSVNQKAVLANRGALLDAIEAGEHPDVLRGAS